MEGKRKRKNKKSLFKPTFIPRDYFGSIYLISNELTMQYKIGVSVSPRKRILNIENQSGMKLKLVDYWELEVDAYEAEKQLHNHFAEYRTIGEWFLFPEEKCEEDIRSNIERLLNGFDGIFGE